MNKHLVLVGMMGSGKTTLARWIENHQHPASPAYDTDSLIEHHEHRSIREIFAQAGEPHFRQLERQLVAELLEQPSGVIATGGGLFIDPDNRRALLEHGIVFYLHAPAEDLMARLAGATNRPLLQTPAAFAALLAEREPIYRQAHHTVPVAHRKARDIGEEILRLYHQHAHASLK